METVVGKGAIKKSKVRTFQKAWLNNSNFKKWLAPYPINNKAVCILCDRTIKCVKADLIRHSQTVKHIRKINRQNNVIKRNNILTHTDKVKRFETKLSAFFAEHDVPFEAVDDLIPLLKDICLEPKIAQEISLGRIKCRKIVTDIIAKKENKQLIRNLQTCKFSILIDEITDVPDKRIICIFVKFVSPYNKKVETQLLELLVINAIDGSADTIFNIFENLFRNKEIPLNNIVAMASDNTSIMIDCNNSFMTRLKSEIPSLVTLNCIYHSSMLVASIASNKLPDSCENLLRYVTTYTSNSTKRCAILCELQEYFNAERKKLLKFSNISWLVFHEYIIKFLDNWDALKNYFLLIAVEENSSSAKMILNLFNNEVKVYLLFLKYALYFFNNFTKLFQSRNILIHKLFDCSQKLIEQMAQNFIVPKALKDITILDVDDKKNIHDINNIYVGPECEILLTTEPIEFMQNVKFKCLDFYITAIQEMCKRLPYKDKIFEEVAFLDPKICLYDANRKKIKDLTYLATRIGISDVNKLASEWQILPSIYNELEKDQLSKLDLDDMWKQILEYRNFDGEKLFPHLKLLVETVLSFPLSNAKVERIFSMVNDVKNEIV